LIALREFLDGLWNFVERVRERFDVLALEAGDEGLHQFLASATKELLAKLDTGDWNDGLEGELKAAMEQYIKQAAV